MRAGNFNINEYLEKLYEEVEEKEAIDKKMSDAEGLILPDENKKTYNWLKKEYNAGKTEVKVEMKLGGAKFEPAMDLQTDLKSVNDFKPGMFGEVKTKDSSTDQKSSNLTSKGSNPNANVNKPAPVTSPSNQQTSQKTGEKPANNQQKPASNQKPGEKPADKPSDEKKDGSETEVKKVDLKTKKK